LSERVRILFKLGRAREQVYARAEDRRAPIRASRRVRAKKPKIPKRALLKAIPAIIAAGDRRAAKAVCGQSKVYLELGGRALVAHVVVALQAVPEVSEVWVVGNAERLREVFESEEIVRELRKPFHIVPQFRNLYENVWQTYRRSLPGAGTTGRDPEAAEEREFVLYVSADMPFATPQEISQFIQRSAELDCDFACGLVTEEAMEVFYPAAPGEPGIRMAYFNLCEGRFRVNNLHLVRPARIVNRSYIEELYEHRYQKQFGNIIGLAARLVRKEEGGLRILRYYILIHIAGIANRRGWRRLADWLRGWIPLDRVAEACSALLRADFRFAVTNIGGCAVDIDNEGDYDVAKLAFEPWRTAQLERAERLHGRLPATSAAAAGESERSN
jgi:molybdopterin-guanine dinucleotide biosynthesis protein A